MESRQAVIVGGGQAGLATAYELKQRGVDCLVLEAHPRIGDSWRRRWDSLRLFTPARLDALPGSRFPAGDMTFPTKDEMADYVEAYAREHRLAVRTGAKVMALRRACNGYSLETAAGSFVTDHVVIATGYDSPRIPQFAAQLSSGIRQLHVIDYQGPQQLSGEVLVIGAGTSGVEAAMDAARAGHRTMLAGRATGEIPPVAFAFGGRIMRFYATRVASIENPIGRRMRPIMLSRGAPLVRLKMADAVRAGVERRPRVTGTRDGAPLFADGTEARPDSIVWCTGFGHDYKWVEFDVRVDAHGYPHQHRGVVQGEPGLYFVGLLFQTSLGSGIIMGVGIDAARVAGTIAARLRAAPPAAVPLQPEPVATGLRAPAGDATGIEG